MHLFNSHEGSKLAFWGSFALPADQTMQPLFKALTDQERPRSMRVLLLILTLSLHLWVAAWLFEPPKPLTPAQPMIMEISLIAAPSAQVAMASVAQPKPVEAKKEPVKKTVKKKPPIIRKPKELPKPLAVADELLPAASKTDLAPVEANAAKVSIKTTTDTAPFTEANFNTNYGSNPKPKYPGIATSRGWEGTVRLLVKVSAEGDSEEVTVQRSSGYDVLDEAAVEAVEKWKFIPAKQGDTDVSSSVIVPIDFVLDN
jgi:protein TonB